jgi:hypothetical protein
MRVEKGTPKSPPHEYNETPPATATGVVKTSGAGEGVCKQSAGLSDEEACADDDDDEDD